MKLSLNLKKNELLMNLSIYFQKLNYQQFFKKSINKTNLLISFQKNQLPTKFINKFYNNIIKTRSTSFDIHFNNKISIAIISYELLDIILKQNMT